MDGLLCAKGLEIFKKTSKLVRYAFQTFFNRGEVYRFRCGDLPQRQAIDIVLDKPPLLLFGHTPLTKQLVHRNHSAFLLFILYVFVIERTGCADFGFFEAVEGNPFVSAVSNRTCSRYHSSDKRLRA